MESQALKVLPEVDKILAAAVCRLSHVRRNWHKEASQVLQRKFHMAYIRERLTKRQSTMVMIEEMLDLDEIKERDAVNSGEFRVRDRQRQ